MQYILPIICIFIFSVFDGSFSSFVYNSVILILGFIYTRRVEKPWRSDAIRILSIVFPLYIGVAFVWSLSFTNGEHFYVIDPVKYISEYIHSRSFDYNEERIYSFFINREGKDIVYVETLRVVSGLSNRFLGGMTVYCMTLIQTLFGVLSSITLYQILCKYYKKDAYKYTLTFSCCSLFLMYSCLIIRDIIIAYFFLEAIRIILGQFKLSNVFVLILLAFLAAGIRMMSGAFLGLFTMLYVYLATRRSKYGTFLTGIFVIIAIILFSVVISSVFYEDSIAEIEERQEHNMEREAVTGGLYNFFFQLPVGIRQITIMLFSQIAPFPPYGTLTRSENLVHFLMGLDVIIYELFWYMVSYTLMLSLLIKKVYRYFTRSENYLLLLSFIFILALTAHPDIRRMMPVYPIIYILYLKSKHILQERWITNVQKNMLMIYAILFFGYLLIKGF